MQPPTAHHQSTSHAEMYMMTRVAAGSPSIPPGKPRNVSSNFGTTQATSNNRIPARTRRTTLSTRFDERLTA